METYFQKIENIKLKNHITFNSNGIKNKNQNQKSKTIKNFIKYS